MILKVFVLAAGTFPWYLCRMEDLARPQYLIGTGRHQKLKRNVPKRLQSLAGGRYAWVKREDGILYEVIDGQQRLRTIWEFRKDAFTLSRDADPIDGHKIAGLKFSQLPPELLLAFDTYQLDVVEIVDGAAADDDDEVRDMFLRLQNGTTLKAQEKRNALSGSMRDFVKVVAKHPFFERCAFSNKRFTFDHVAAQTILLELSGGPANAKDADLNRMYRENPDFDASGHHARKVRRVYDFLLKAFPEKTPELERYNVITLYALASLLLDGYVSHQLEQSLAAWFIDFEVERRNDERLPEDERDVSLIEYRRLISTSTDAEESIRARLDMFERRFFEANPSIEPKDSERGFSHEQRLAIYRRDGGICQVRVACSGDKVAWGHWHADHKIPHTHGGKSTVENGQVSCPACNLKKGAAKAA
ncbi:MAG: HNH endonuclease [Alphaproteobacteria bacterium]|nr:MAG: HNH endonuclease [Alphaproteobacteria bacterium]